MAAMNLTAVSADMLLPENFKSFRDPILKNYYDCRKNVE